MKRLKRGEPDFDARVNAELTWIVKILRHWESNESWRTAKRRQQIAIIMLILLIIAILSPALKQRLIGQLENNLLRLWLSYKLSCSTQSLLISFFLKGPQIPTGFTPPPPTSNSLDLCDSSQPPKPLSNTFNATLIGQVISTEKVFSDIQCIDFCLRSLSCKAYNMESRGSTIYCITLATIERIQEKKGSSYRRFDREKIEKVCSLKKIAFCPLYTVLPSPPTPTFFFLDWLSFI